MSRKAPGAEKPGKSRKKPPGRPSLYSAELAATLCARIVEGESMRSICRDEAMPAISTVFLWLSNNSSFLEQYTRAKEEQADTLADEIVEIADEAAYENIEVEGAVLGVKFDSTAVARNRLRVDARKWVAAKLRPKKYGDAVTLKGDKDNPLQIAKPVDLSDADLLALAAGDKALDG